MTVTREHRGAYVISAIVSGFLVTRQYFGYTKREAARLFREEVLSK